MKNMKKCMVTYKTKQMKNKLDKRRGNKRCSSAGMFYTSSAGAVTSLICFGNQKMLFRTRVAPVRRHGRSALILGRNLRNVLYSIFLITLPVLFVHQAYATASTLTISVTDSVSLDMTSIGTSGTFAHSDKTTNNVSIKTTNGTGYTLGIKAKTNNSNALINSDDTSKTIPSITSSISESTYESSTSYNNTWGLRPSKLNSVVNENYIQAPTSSSTLTTLDQTSSANPSTANNYNLAIGARINGSTVPGSYSNVFVITATANPIPYTITYNKNTTDTVTNMPANTSSSTYSETVNISSTVPARDGFNFKGWCTTQVADGGTCTGITYNPDGGGTSLTWTLNQTTSSNSLTLYAMWGASSINLYDTVASAWVKEGSRVMTNDSDTNTGIRAAITTSNSGVFKYNPSTFGTASDAANTSDIYFYRGILDNTTGSYGSNGDNAAHPNTVVLSSASNKSGLTGTDTDIDNADTCWRIVRTTGSGGVKMIYQGKWTGSTCANSEDNAQVATSAFNGTSSTYRQIVRVGYTHNSTYATNTSKSGTIAQIFGTNSNPAANNTRSTIKEYIEDTWYPGSIGASSGHDFTSKLEASAGYCNDRTMNTSNNWTTPRAESTTIASTYGTSGQQQYYFGARPRTASTAQPPSLTCGNKYSQIDRSTVDLYRYVSGSTGVSNQLKYPTALLTADEAAFAGSGSSSTTTPYHANSFLRSGSVFWLLSPYYRASAGTAGGFNLASGGNLNDDYRVNTARGVRPAISLKPGSEAVSGSGTATDPWIVNPLINEYCTDEATCMQTSTACDTTLTDGRDGATYTTATIAGSCWMTQNLRFNGTELKVGKSDVTSDTTMTYGQLTSGDSFTEPRIATGSTTDYGTYYNYCAASAGEVCNDTTKQDATRSVCPAGWKLPTQAQFNAVPEMDSHFTASSGLAGFYFGGSLFYAGGYGIWWASTASSASATGQYILACVGGNDWRVDSALSKSYGLSVRCVRAS